MNVTFDVKINDLDSNVAEYHRLQAKQHPSKTMKGYLKDLLQKEAQRPKLEFLKKLNEFHATLAPPPPGVIYETSVEMVRNEREEREQRILPL